MGLLNGTTHQEYYQGNDHGNYQFTSLDDIINQFMVVYVGEGKIIPKTRRLDVAFHAQRAMQELSFDTFKSVKSHQIDLPPSLKMILPHDYVNYTKISWVDSAGIKHLLYPTSNTNNPFQIKQETGGAYTFSGQNEMIVNGGFDSGDLSDWLTNPDAWMFSTTYAATTQITSNVLTFSHRTRHNYDGSKSTPSYWGHVMSAWQVLDVSDKTLITLSADGTAVDMDNGAGVLRVGLSTSAPDSVTTNFISTAAGHTPSTNSNINTFDLLTTSGSPSYLEWTVAGDNTTSKTLTQIDVSDHNTVYVIVTSYQDFTGANSTLTQTNTIDDISVMNSFAETSLVASSGNEKNSSTWNSYKSGTPSENQNQYDDDTYWPMDGSRFGLDPQHAQANGSFYIDNRLGKIHFSSNISGKTVILDYISDSLGTDGEMQVHKFAEEAMYKWISHAILAGKANIPEYQVNRFKKERFAAIRTAKLRLSNIKLEEITQILRGKSKQIKH